VNESKDIVLVADYHAENIEQRWFNEATGEERTLKYPTARAGILRQVESAAQEVSPGGRLVWIMESTTGWARVKDLLGPRVKFVLSNVLQMPLPPKGKRRKSDKIDTARSLREYLQGKLPQSFQPDSWWRQVRRLVDGRQDLVGRQTAVKNWITSLLAHETWEDRENLWSLKGRRRLQAMAWPACDRLLMELKLEQLDQLKKQIAQVEAQMRSLYVAWPDAQRVDQVRGIGMVRAVSLLARIGPIQRFRTAGDLIAYAGLVPGMWQSDGTCHHGRIGGSGTDAHLRYLVIEASMWLCQIPRYRPAYERIVARRGNKIGRIVVARLFLRSLYKMLRDGVRFHPGAGAPSARPEAEPTSNGAFNALEPTASAKGKRPSTEEGRLAVGAETALGSLASGALSSAPAPTR
jgi:transposase